MRPLAMKTFVLLAGTIAIWLAATIDPVMLWGSVCGEAHCWRCDTLFAAIAILVASAIQQINLKPVRH